MVYYLWGFYAAEFGCFLFGLFVVGAGTVGRIWPLRFR